MLGLRTVDAGSESGGKKMNSVPIFPSAGLSFTSLPSLSLLVSDRIAEKRTCCTAFLLTFPCKAIFSLLFLCCFFQKNEQKPPDFQKPKTENSKTEKPNRTEPNRTENFGSVRFGSDPIRFGSEIFFNGSVRFGFSKKPNRTEPLTPLTHPVRIFWGATVKAILQANITTLI